MHSPFEVMNIAKYINSEIALEFHCSVNEIIADSNFKRCET